ncbi:hypothetical protein JCM8097_004401 [Rhodosporidiobolus ruineniae]
MSTLDRPATPTKDKSSRSSTPNPLSQAQKLSRPGTPARGSRPGTPSRLQKCGMPNNLDLADPRTQDRASDLHGMPGTEALKDPPTEDELQKVRDLAAQLEKKKK